MGQHSIICLAVQFSQKTIIRAVKIQGRDRNVPIVNRPDVASDIFLSFAVVFAFLEKESLGAQVKTSIIMIVTLEGKFYPLRFFGTFTLYKSPFSSSPSKE